MTGMSTSNKKRFIANDIEDEYKKVTAFLTMIDADKYGLLRNLIAPIKTTT